MIGRGGQLVGGGSGEKRNGYGTTPDVSFCGPGQAGNGHANGTSPGPGTSWQSGDYGRQVSPLSAKQGGGITPQKQVKGHNGIEEDDGKGGTNLLEQDGSLSDPNKIHYDGSTECTHGKLREGLDKTARNRLLIASLLCMMFMVGEIVGGVLSNSLAIISDGVHLLTDFASFIIAMSALHLAQRPSSKKLNFGWHRIEILGALLSILLLWVLTGVLCYSAVGRILHTDYEINSKILIISASTGVFFNICLATVLNEDLELWKGKEKDKEEKKTDEEKALLPSGASLERSRSPSDGLSRSGKRSLSSSVEVSRVKAKPGNINVKAAYIHVLGDLVQSLGILVSALIIWFKPEWKISDPICTFFFSFMVILTTSYIMKDVLVVLMEAAPKDVDVAGMKTDLLNVPGVVGLHSYRVWSLTLDKIAVSVHLNVAPEADPYNVLDDATYVLRELHWAFESNVQLERGHVG